jgi:arsenical pump membrane protein
VHGSFAAIEVEDTARGASHVPVAAPVRGEYERVQFRRAVAALVPRLAFWGAVVAGILATRPDPALSLMLVALAGVVTIVSDARFAIERRIEDAGLPSREAWVPLVMLPLMVALDLVEHDRITAVVAEHGPVIAFILAIAVVSEGLRQCGFFHYLAYRLTTRAGGGTTRLTLYLFLLSSLLAYITSNDMVILTMTPIVLSVVHQARIPNAKLLLLSQFVAANTVSMGLLIGSPTNLILARAVGIDFLEYLSLMAVPALLALMGTFVVVTWINGAVTRLGDGSRVVRWLIGTWRYSPQYRPLRFADQGDFTHRMGRWVATFALSVVLMAFGAATSTGLLRAATVIATVGTASLWWERRRHAVPADRPFVREVLRVLPVGIVFFGLSYFVIADAIADTPFVRDRVSAFVSDAEPAQSPVRSWTSILTSGVLVNTMNDLPAAALVGKALARVDDDFATPVDRMVVVQGLVVGLNIAAYVTPVGALAGIIWFDVVRKDRERRRITPPAGEEQPFVVVMPTRRDLIVYGGVMFLVMTVLLGVTNFGFGALAGWVTALVNGRPWFRSLGHVLWMLAGLATAIVVVVWFRRVLRANGVTWCGVR